MRVPLPTYTLLLIGLLSFSTHSQSLVDNRNSYCSSATLDPQLLSASQLSSNRNHTYTDFYSNYTKLFQFYNDTSSTTFIQLMNYQFGLYITLVLLIVISFIFFFVTFCWKCSYSYNCWHECLWIFAILFLIFVGLFIAILVFIGISQYHTGNAYCSLYSFPAAVLYGNPGVYHKQEFIGYQPFLSFIGNYTAEVPQIGAKLNDMTAIINSQISSVTQSSIANTTAWWASVSNSTVNSGVGSALIHPDVIIANPASVSLELESEFNTLDILARELLASASEGKFLTSASYVNATQTGLATLAGTISSNFNSLSNVMEKFTQKGMQLQSYSIAGFWTFFGLSIAIILLGLFVLIVFCCMRKGKYRTCITCMRISLLIIAFLAIIYGICVLILMAGISGMSSFCKFVAELNQGGWTAANTFTDFLGDAEGGLVKNCFFKNGTGYLPDVIGSTPYVTNSYNRLIDLVEGMTSFRIYTAKNPGFLNTTSPSIQNQISVWRNISNGQYLDNYPATSAFNTFIGDNSCDSRHFELTSTACSFFNLTNCVGISSSSSYSPAGCVSASANASAIYTNLYNYILSEQSLLALLTTGISNSPLTSYTTVISSFQNINANVLSFQSVFPNTQKSVSNYNNTLLQITQCSNLQVELSQFERYACFPFTKPLYVLLVIATVSTLFLFFMIWALVSLICFKEDDARNLPVIQKEEFLAVSEQELVPKY